MEVEEGLRRQRRAVRERAHDADAERVGLRVAAAEEQAEDVTQRAESERLAAVTRAGGRRSIG